MVGGRIVKFGIPIVWGISDPKPLQGFPPGKCRIRIRNDQPVRVYVRWSEPKGIMCFYVVEQDGKWVPALEAGMNLQVVCES